MNDFDFNMDIDSILAEFTGSVPGTGNHVNGIVEDAEPEKAYPAYEKPIFSDPGDTVAQYVQVDDSKDRQTGPGTGSESKSKHGSNHENEREPGRRSGREPERIQKQKSRRTDGRDFQEYAEETVRKSVSGIKRFVMAFTGLVFGVLSAGFLLWMLVNVHPDTGMASSQLAVKKRADVVTRIDTYSGNMKGELLSNLATFRKHYIIPEGDLAAPEAPVYNFGTTTDKDELLAVIEEARSYGLLDGQNMIFSPDVDFYYDSDIQYYCDETLLVICWKELIDNRICSCVEVKTADGSQLRRKLAEDTYGSSTYVYATELAAQSNAVVAMNADYYAFRDLGITVFDRHLYRFDESSYNGKYSKYNATDTLFIDSRGNFLTFKKGQTSTREEMERFIAENDIMFSIAFGPVLVEDWGQTWTDWYPVGETDKEYSRAGIAQYDDLHYFYMTVSFADNENEYHPRCTVNEFAGLMAEKGVRLAYCLDGGQTGEVVFRGTPYNHIDFGTERTVSDIIYFASAVPESER